ncbi:MAG: NAD(P)H-dependent oxidoreductase subunit E, partial [Acidobacteriota bacterium]
MSLTGELYRLQETHGYLKDTDLRDLARRLHVPLHRLQGLASFYPHFRTTPPPEVTV